MSLRRYLRWFAPLLLVALLLLVRHGIAPAGTVEAPAASAAPSDTPSPEPLTLTLPPMTPAPTAEPSPSPTPTPTATPSPTPTATPSPTPTPTPSGLCGGRYPDKFTEEEVITDTSYQSKDLAIFLKKVHDEESFSSFVTYFVADIYVQDIELWKTAPAGKDFHAKAAGSVKKMARDNNALLAASGDYYAHSMQALIIRNGVSYNPKPSTRFESCVLFRDGTLGFYKPEELDPEALLAAGAWQGWTFGPSLLEEDGQPKTAMPKTYAGHYCLVVVDGRQRAGRYSVGLTLLELSQLAYDLGCVKAYNLDGGQSAQICWQGQIYNHPTGGGRSISDILYFAAP